MTKSAIHKVGVHEAKTHLSELLRAVASGAEVEILRNGKPVAKLVPVIERTQRVFGQDRGVFEVPDDFDAPLPDDILDSFYQ
jgi:prevent-host-death family protein